MQTLFASRKTLLARKSSASGAVWLMTALAVIIIVVVLISAADNGMGRPHIRSRAAAEVQAISTALESFKTDHGSYPPAAILLTNYLGNDVTESGGKYQLSSQTLYRALSGQTNFTDVPSVESKAYIVFIRNQVGDAPGGSFVKDPSGNSYGYSTGTETSYPYNGKGYFDLWSTAGTKGISTADTNSWISNWQ